MAGRAKEILIKSLPGIAVAALLALLSMRVSHLIGLRMSFVDAAGMLRVGAPVVLVAVVVGLVLPHLINRWIGQPGRLVTLIGVGTSICGVSAIAAISPGIRAGPAV